jgi:hypothetical protein
LLEFVWFDGSCSSLQNLVVHMDDLPNTADFEILTVFFGKGLNELSDLGVVIARHSREQMVLKLILHAAEEIFGQEIVTADPTCSRELISRKSVGCVGRKDLFSLMVASDNNSNKESGDED